MEIKEYQAITEAILFASGEPVEISRLAEVLELDEDTVERLTDDLMNEINTRTGGIKLVRLDKSYQMCTRSEYADYVRRALDIRRNTPLTQAAMEVLAIVAYNQPVTRAFIDQVRGVDCAAVIQGLIAKSLIEEKGRLIFRKAFAIRYDRRFFKMFRNFILKRASAASAKGCGFGYAGNDAG